MGQQALFDPVMIKKWGNREPKSSRFRGAFALPFVPRFRSLSLWFSFWKSWPDLSGFDQTEYSLSFLPSQYPTPLRLANARTFALHIFEQIQWRRKGGLHYVETEVQDKYVNGQSIKYTVTPTLGGHQKNNPKLVYAIDFDVTPHLIHWVTWYELKMSLRKSL